MNLDNVATSLHLRSHWQALDLGFQMARHWLGPLTILWFATALPVAILASLLLFDYQWALGLVIWWLKPLYELPLLHFLSRSLFGETPALKESLRESLWHNKTTLFSLLTWRRFSLSRSFYNPVHMLEGLTGDDKKARLDILGRSVGNASQWLLFICYQFEVVLYLSISFSILFIIPEGLISYDIEDLFATEGWASYFSLMFYFVAMMLVAPFYTTAGFTLYINRRTELESWDIEISFKKLKQRLQNHASRAALPLLLVLTFTMGTSFPQHGIAEENAANHEQGKSTAAQYITDVLADSDFGESQTNTVWKRIEKEAETPTNDPAWLTGFLETLEEWVLWFAEIFSSVATFLQFLLWIALAVLGILLVRYLMTKFNVIAPAQRRSKRESTTQLFGMRIDDLKLTDVNTQLNQLLIDGDYRGALSLLYRASLSELTHQHKLDIPESFTERQCLTLVQQKRAVAEAEFFARLTFCWIKLAYGHEEPGRETLESLGRDWRIHYGVRTQIT